MDKIKDGKYFTKLDIRWGYNNVRIKEGDEWKAAFKTNRGLYKPMVMFFGMCNSPATFQAILKTQFTSKPMLMMLDQTKPFQIKCDVSKYVSGAVLTQLDSNGDRHPCAFISKTFSPTERNYEIYDRELLAII